MSDDLIFPLDEDLPESQGANSFFPGPPSQPFSATHNAQRTANFRTNAQQNLEGRRISLAHSPPQSDWNFGRDYPSHRAQADSVISLRDYRISDEEIEKSNRKLLRQQMRNSFEQLSTQEARHVYESQNIYDNIFSSIMSTPGLVQETILSDPRSRDLFSQHELSQIAFDLRRASDTFARSRFSQNDRGRREQEEGQVDDGRSRTPRYWIKIVNFCTRLVNKVCIWAQTKLEGFKNLLARVFNVPA